jgi:hypothetical protein
MRLPTARPAFFEERERLFIWYAVTEDAQRHPLRLFRVFLQFFRVF